MAKTIKLEDAMKQATYVSTDIDLKTAVQRGDLVVISTDNELYEKLLKKFPMEKVTKGVSKAGNKVAGVGVILTVATGGLLGLPLVGYGILAKVAGNLLDDYKNHTILMDYDKRQVQFIKTKGNPHVKI